MSSGHALFVSLASAVHHFSCNCFLLLQVGEEILVTAMHIGGQWEGELKNGAKGFFPFTHIQFIDIDDAIDHD